MQEEYGKGYQKQYKFLYLVNIVDIASFKDTHILRYKFYLQSNMNNFYKLLAGILFIWICSWFFIYWRDIPYFFKNTTSSSQEVPTNNSTWTSAENIVGISLLQTEDYSWAIAYYENRVRESVNYTDKVLLSQAYLQYGYTHFEENAYAKKSLEILNTITEENYDVLYTKWYTYELMSDYSWALIAYEKGLAMPSLTIQQKSVLLYQIGHTYSLLWNIEYSYQYFVDAYKIDPTNVRASVEIGKYNLSTWNLDDGLIYIRRWLATESNTLKSEIYALLSSAIIELWRPRPNITMAMDYAKDAIISYPEYPMGYIALAKAQYMKNESRYDKEIIDNLTKAIKINPNRYEAYRIYGLHLFDTEDFTWSIVLLAKSLATINSDTSLSLTSKKNAKDRINIDMLLLSIIKKLDTKTLLDTLQNTFIPNPVWRNAVQFQINRDQYWVFKDIKNESLFIEFVQKYFNK